MLLAAAASGALGLNWLAALLIVTMGVLGVVVLVQSAWRSIVGYALVAGSAGLLIELCATWSRSIHA